MTDAYLYKGRKQNRSGCSGRSNRTKVLKCQGVHNSRFKYLRITLFTINDYLMTAKQMTINFIMI